MTMVEGVDYSPGGIEDVRVGLIAMRDEAMRQWPEGISTSVLLSHAIALLSELKGRIEKDTE